MDFEQIVLRLSHYWNEQGCTLLQPYDLPMGAATFHPATLLRAVGREAWKCAYVQGCRRPADSRYGKTPNRLQHYYQFQVVLKPSPQEARELFIDSLRALEMDCESIDIRFMEDNWESPTLGASGVGWEVLLNGMEICQFTYFQQVGGLECDPVLCELAYGLERIALYLQKVDSIFDLSWSKQVDYRDVFYTSEVEHSTYNLELANTTRLVKLFAECEKDCNSLAARELTSPAYETVVMASHYFNLLDARSAISPTQRQSYILRTRRMASMVMKLASRRERQNCNPTPMGHAHKRSSAD